LLQVSSSNPSNASESHLKHVVEHVAHLLPAQGPISVFIHHNTLHAFEQEVFEDAVLHGGRYFGCEPFLTEDRYREELRRGRIAQRDLEAVLEADLGARAEQRIAGQMSRGELWHRVLVHGIADALGAPLHWVLSETQALTRFREDLPSDARESLPPGASPEHDAGDEARLVRDLWRACLDAVGRSSHLRYKDPIRYVRHRDLLLATCNVDTDEWMHPVLIRFTSAYLDQGLAHWAMPQRDRGMYGCFLELYGRPLARLCGGWAGSLNRVITDDRSMGRDAWSSLRESLLALGVPTEEWQSFLVEEALTLRGWAGMVNQFGARPDRVPAFPLPARLVDYLAIRLLLSRAALSHAARIARINVPLSELRAALRPKLPASLEPNATERAWPIFQVAQLCGLDAAMVDALSESEIADLEAELTAFDHLARRRLFHLAYERHLRHRFYDAVVQHEPTPPPPAPTFQAIFCIDEREESFRRHLEEVEPRVETYGTAGFFGVAMYFRGATDAHPRPLCPVAIRPQHYVTEAESDQHDLLAWWRRTRKRFAALVGKNVHLGSRTFSRGAVLMATLGALWVVPLVLRVLFPWSRRGLSHLTAVLSPEPQTRLRLDRAPEAAPIGRHVGFTQEEMADIVHRQLQPLGIKGRMAPLVFVLGHGSTSLNNPQESAHDCGACGGGRGGPNARAFAQMANDPGVRVRLAELGTHIPVDTWFVGGQRNTANNDIVFFDEDLVPETLRPLLEQAKASFESARRREAHERCRRFEAFPSWMPQQAALVHVQTRASDLAQPRPEYGHATNAVCLIGRRSRTRGLFLDRRAFLVSYDPSQDANGTSLAHLLSAVVPVVAGISLEYFFGYVDPTGYGCGTKLPHNVTCLLGVMDGAQSDLRTGLPWQMLEIHEPVRLAMIVEATPDVLLRILNQDANLRRLVDHRWVFLASLDPRTNVLFEIDAAGVRRYAPEHPLKVIVGSSQTHYRGRRGHLLFARIDPSPVKRESL
jgi:hypothetical protein